MARIGAPAYLRGVIKDVLLLIVGVTLAALSWPMLAHSHPAVSPLRIGRLGGGTLFLGLALIVAAVADWRYRTSNAPRP
jgi:hypothetical protein